MSEVPPKHGRYHHFFVDLTAVEGWLEKGKKTYSAHGDFMQKSHLPEIQEYERGV